MPEDKNKDLSSDEDYLLFRESMRDVKTLVKTERYIFEEKPKPKPVKKNLVIQTSSTAILTQETNTIESNEVLFFTRNGVQHKTIKQLKRGSLIIDERVDLHGLTQQEAHQLLLEFLVEQTSQRHRCILIVHGKGIGSLNNRPVLKNLVYNLLRNEPSVLAFSSAQQRDGGTGAVYVLLKSI